MVDRFARKAVVGLVARRMLGRAAMLDHVRRPAVWAGRAGSEDSMSRNATMGAT